MVRAVATASMAPAPPEGVPGDALDGGDRGRRGAEHLLDGLGLGQVVEGGGGPVRVDVPDVAAAAAAASARASSMQAAAPLPPGAGRGDVMGVGGRARPQELGVDARPAPAGVVEVLEHQRRTALRRTRSRRAGRRRAGTCLRSTAPSCCRRRPGRSRPWRLRQPPPMVTSQRPVATSRAAAAMAWVPAAHAVAMVSHGPWNPACIDTWAAPAFTIIMGMRNGRHAPRALLVEHADLVLQRLEAPHAGGEDHAGTVGVGTDLARVDERHVGGRHRELRETVDAPDFLGAEPGARVEAHHPALAVGRGLEQAVPEGVEADPAARDDAHAGDDDSRDPGRARRARRPGASELGGDQTRRPGRRSRCPRARTRRR